MVVVDFTCSSAPVGSTQQVTPNFPRPEIPRRSSSIILNTSATHSTCSRTLIRRRSLRRRRKSLIRRYHEWKHEHLYLGRYSIEKMLALENYQRQVSPVRVVAVIALTPFPSLIIVLLLASIPLQSPLLPVANQFAYFLQSWLSFSVVTFAMLLYMRCALILPRNVYSHRQCLLISVLTAGANEAVMIFLSFTWRFPIPLRDILGAAPFSVLFVFFHVLVLRSRLRDYYSRIRAYIPLYSAQLATFFVFEAIAILFQNVPVWAKMAITIAFPVLRSVLKHSIRKLSYALEDISTEGTLCVVEVFGALFQNVCLQSSRSLSVSGFMILVDFVQAIVEVKMYLDHKFVVDGRLSIQTAVKIVESALFPGAASARAYKVDKDVPKRKGLQKISHRGISQSLAISDVFSRDNKSARSPPRKPRSSKVACLTPGCDDELDLGSIHLGVLDRELISKDPVIAQSQDDLVGLPQSATRRSSVDDVEISHRHHTKLLTQTLQLVYSSEVLIFAEYSEFMCSVIYGLYTLCMYHMPNAKYSLCFIGLSSGNFWQSVVNCTIYALLEGITFVFLFSLVRAKFGLSTFYQLAFVLEKYWMSVQGKLISSLTLIFILHTIHQGNDLTLRFDWERLLTQASY